MKRPLICEKRGCYIRPKFLFPEWDALNIRCNDCPYEASEGQSDKCDIETSPDCRCERAQ